MRQIGSISNLNAVNRFADHLRAEGIACEVDEGTGGYRIWVHHDDHVAKAKQEFAAYQNDPDHQRYRDASDRAMSRIRDDMTRMRQARAKTVNVAETWSRPIASTCPMTVGLIVMSLVFTYYLGINPDVIRDQRVHRILFSSTGTLSQILSGEVWRLFSPIFLHFGMLHLGFNMLNTYQFGTLMESRIGTFKFLLIVAVIAAVSNYAQFRFGSVIFGGMSGVDFGMFGYMWVRGRRDPASGLALSRESVSAMVFFQLLCSFGVIPSVANYCHIGGMAAGAVIAFAETALKPLWNRR